MPNLLKNLIALAERYGTNAVDGLLAAAESGKKNADVWWEHNKDTFEHSAHHLIHPVMHHAQDATDEVWDELKERWEDIKSNYKKYI